MSLSKSESATKQFESPGVRLFLQVEMCLGCSELDRNRRRLRVDPILTVGGRSNSILQWTMEKSKVFVSHRCRAYYMVKIKSGCNFHASFSKAAEYSQSSLVVPWTEGIILR